jgi:hypothetical protein
VENKKATGMSRGLVGGELESERSVHVINGLLSPLSRERSTAAPDMRRAFTLRRKKQLGLITVLILRSAQPGVNVYAP